jgi:hypothetical protein
MHSVLADCMQCSAKGFLQCGSNSLGPVIGVIRGIRWDESICSGSKVESNKILGLAHEQIDAVCKDLVR